MSSIIQPKFTNSLLNNKIKSAYESALEERDYITKRYNNEVKSLDTGWSKINELTMNGLEFGTVVTISGMSGPGKTLFLNQLEDNLFNLNRDVDFDILNLNFEMLSRRLIGRKISGKIHKSVKELYSASENALTVDDMNFINEYVESFKNKNIFYMEMTDTIDKIREVIINFAKERKIISSDRKLIVTLDHSLLIRRKTGQSVLDALGELMETINILKKVLQDKILFILVSQLNRNIEASDRIAPAQNKLHLMYPQKSDLYGSERNCFLLNFCLYIIKYKKLG